MLRKIIVSSLFVSLLNIPITAECHEHHEHNKHKHHEHKHKMMNFFHEMNENTIKMMKENYESSKLLFNKGVELVKEANKNLSYEEMLKGLSLIITSMDISYHPVIKMTFMHYEKEECESCKLNKNKKHECKECSLKRKEHEEFIKKLGYSKDEHEKMVKDLQEVVTIVMNTGNKLIKDGSKENNISKMEMGAELTKKAFKIHHKNKMLNSLEK